MGTHLGMITFDATDAARLATFWAAVFDWQVGRNSNPQVAMVRDPDRAASFDLLFIRVPEGKQAKNRCHLDLRPDEPDLDTEVARLVGLGATTGDEHHEYGVRWRTLFDPDGNEFCVGVPDQDG